MISRWFLLFFVTLFFLSNIVLALDLAQIENEAQKLKKEKDVTKIIQYAEDKAYPLLLGVVRQQEVKPDKLKIKEILQLAVLLAPYDQFNNLGAILYPLWQKQRKMFEQVLQQLDKTNKEIIMTQINLYQQEVKEGNG